MGTETATIRRSSKPGKQPASEPLHSSAAHISARHEFTSSAIPHSFAAIPPLGSRENRLARSSHSGPLLPLQRKLAIGAVNDPLEAEADAMADRVMRGSLGTVATPDRAKSSTVQRKCSCEGSGQPCAACEEEKNKLQRKCAQGEPAAKDDGAGLILRRTPALGWTGDKANPGLLSVPTSSTTIERNAIEGLSTPSRTGKVIVLRPAGIDLSKPVDILFHLHGHNEGYKQLRDRDVEKIEEQLAGSGRTQMIAILPQGTSGSEFGKSGAGLDSDTYIDSVFDALVSLKVWASKPPKGQVLLSAHSGGGGPIGEEMLPGKAGASMPSNLKEIALFDAINGPHECKAVADWITTHLSSDLAELKKSGMTEATQKQYLSKSTKFRGFHTGAKTTTASDSKNASYASRYAWVQARINDWFTTNSSDVSALPADVQSLLHKNYSIESISSTTDLNIHNQAVALGSHLQSAITDMPVQPFRMPDSPARTGAVPAEVGHALRSSGQPLPQETRNEMESSFGADFSRVRIHQDSTAAKAAASVNALAFTVGRDIVFGGRQYAPQTSNGRRLLAHELTHTLQQGQIPGPVKSESLRLGPVHDSFESEASANERLPGISHRLAEPKVQRQPDQRTLREQFCEDPARKIHTEPGACTYKEPENCALYGDWIASFTRLKTFEAADTAPGINPLLGFKTLGQKAASHDPAAAASEQAPTPVSPRIEDRFIDHATDEWVRNCLPDNLRATAYQLPSDCADIAVILRHVWLSAHHRTEVIPNSGGSNWVIGDKAGGAAQKTVGKVIGEIYSGNVRAMVNPYADDKGNPLRSFAALEPLLHPGDILVWEHHSGGLGTARTGGHTHTIASISRVGGRIQEMTLLQGNEPIDDTTYAQISKFLADENKKSKKKTPIPSRKVMGQAPGRRVEVDSLEANSLRDLTPPVTKSNPSPQSAWTWADGHTTLVVAGPPRAAARPAMHKEGGVLARRISDWFGALQAATREALPGTLEAALAEARAVIEGGKTVADSDAAELGRIAGQKIWDWAKASPGFGNVSHFEPLKQLQDTVRGFGDLDFPGGFFGALLTALGTENPHEDEVRRVFRIIESSFVDAARGGSSIDFTRKASKGTKVVNTLVTGFDPFTGRQAKPDRGEWNPSGAAALALDGQTVNAESGVIAAVEGVVLPVSFDEFRAGLVERIMRPQMGKLDAVLTVSLDPNLSPTDPVRLERYAVGVHRLDNNQLEAIPAAPGGTEGPRIIEAPAPLETIAAETEQKTGSAVSIQKPTFGNDIALKFHNAADANIARAELKMPASNSDELIVNDQATVRQIINTAQIALASAIHFQVIPKGKTHEADLLRGPGGDFLSNEVSYRTQRLLLEAKNPRDPVSFHTHVPGTGELLPDDTSTKEGKAILARARELKERIIRTLRSMIAAVARVIAHR